MSAIAIIPARGGSKGIPRKNLTLLRGKPLIAWTIEAAKSAGKVAEIYVSTDDEEIASTAEKLGAKTVLRPSEISGDNASSEAAICHTLTQLRDNGLTLPDVTVFLQCTAPLLVPTDIDGAIGLIEDQHFDSSFAAAPSHSFLWRADTEGVAASINHDSSKRQLRQHRDLEYTEAGSVYAMRTAEFLEQQHRFFGKTGIYSIDPWRCIEIDEPDDLVLASALIQKLAIQRHRLILPDGIDAIVTDFDGTLTNDMVYLSESGEETVRCSRSDGMGFKFLREAGIPTLILSTEQNRVVSRRAEKLKTECLQGIENKRTALAEWCTSKGYSLSKVIYLGNDINDLEVMKSVGCAAMPSDGNPAIAEACSIILNSKGGEGAFRELTDLVLSQNVEK